ncbi:MAG: hypothetical protein JWM19_7496 [Actinomycetia bacterium]|nr:hypothetical protein [Actinomycetes bacterium]
MTIWFIIIALMLVAGIVLRLLPRKLPPVQLNKVAPSAASRLVSDFIASSYETDFGYPSGYFQIERATESEVVAKEWVTKGSHFTQILSGFYRAILALGAPFGCFGVIVTLWIALIATPALLYAALTETILKYLLRSRVVAAFERAGDGVRVTFTLRGPSALLVGRRLERAFNEPVLPARVASLAGIVVAQQATATGPAANTGPTAAPEGAAA